MLIVTSAVQPTLSLFMSGRGRRHFPLDELHAMQADTNYTWLIWKNGERVLMPRTLKYYEARLPAEQFVRLHRHVLVNVNQIAQVEKPHSKQMTVTLRTGEQIAVSRRRIARVAAQLGLLHN
jgi:DNA-binding LytR/AlgR family response regulator